MIIYSTKPVATWTVEEVVDWSRKVLYFLKEDQEILRKQEVDGRKLLALKDLDAVLKILPYGPATVLLTAIEKMKKSQHDKGKSHLDLSLFHFVIFFRLKYYSFQICLNVKFYTFISNFNSTRHS